MSVSKDKVLAKYPAATCKTESSGYGFKTAYFTIIDPVKGDLGPTAFGEELAWVYAAERVNRGE